MVQLVTNGVLIGKYRPTDSEDEVDIRVRLPETSARIDRFDQLRLQTPLGLVPLANFVDRSPAQKVVGNRPRDGLYSMMLKATVKAADENGSNPVEQVAGTREVAEDASPGRTISSCSSAAPMRTRRNRASSS
jgi:multidrug efflux pump